MFITKMIVRCTMKVVISGSRSITDPSVVYKALDECGFDITEMISGNAIGVDMFGERWAKDHNIPTKIFKPDYNLYKDRPKFAPLARNTSMAIEGDALVAVCKNKSYGTMHMVNEMKKLHKPIYLVEV